MATLQEKRALRIKAPVEVPANLAINAEVARLRAAGREVLHLGFGESRYPGHPKLLAALREGAGARSYAPVAGMPELRQAVAQHYRTRFGLETDASRALIGVGSKSLLFAALAAVDGDVVLTTPRWVSYETQVRMAGQRVIVAPTRAEERYLLTPEALVRRLDEARREGARPAALLLNSPDNPTGAMYPADRLARLADVARTEGLLVISDEIYALTAFGAIPHTSMARFYPEGTIVTGGLSKHLSLGGWRLGVALLPSGENGERLLRCMTGVAGSIWTSVAAPVQSAALVAYGGDPEIDAYVEACAAVQGRITIYLYRVLRKLGVSCPEPAGGFYLYPDLAPWREALRDRHGVTMGRELAETLLAEADLAVLPGSDFGAEPRELTLRLSTSLLHALAGATVEEVMAIAGEPSSESQLRDVCPDAIEAGERLAAFLHSLEAPAKRRVGAR